MKFPKFDDESNLPNLSNKEKNQFRYLAVSYRIFIDLVFRNKFLNLMFISSIIIFSFGSIFVFLDIKSPYGITDPIIALIYFFIYSILAGIFIIMFYIIKRLRFNMEEWFKKYILLWSKMAIGLIFVISILIIFLLLSFFIIAIQEPSFAQDAKISILITTSLYFICFIAMLVLPLYFESFKFHNEFFLYAKNRIEKLNSYRDKIKAVSCLWLIRRIYFKEFDVFFGKESIIVIKLNNLILLTEEILKLDKNSKDFDTKKNDIIEILSGLARADPFDSTQKFIDIMDNIENKFNNKEFLKKYDEKVIFGKKYIGITPAKIYTILLIISSIIGLIRITT